MQVTAEAEDESDEGPVALPGHSHRKCGLCDTYNISHVKNVCAFLGDGMSRIEGSYVLPSNFEEVSAGVLKNACNFLKIVCKPLCFSTHAFGGIWEVDLSDSTHRYRRLAPSSELIVYALITVLDNVSDIDILEIRQQADSALFEFLHEIKNSQ
ncbi:hypothetical protein L6452_06690 [Arctium lappa]|uniref:Uncharacterized protein n=1 Tax=Arctium lappa TaxID=4217 RepID=A0ACB9EK47_ARCLA|nr:hypothetical protein L6452_06690 [Arctium lappa]